MGLSDPQYTRLKTIILLFLLIFFVYSCEFVFFGTSGSQEIVTSFDDIDNLKQPEPDIWKGIEQALSILIGFLVFGFQVLTFTLPSVPMWMTIIMAPLMIVVVVIAGYILFDFIYDFVKALPFT